MVGYYWPFWIRNTLYTKTCILEYDRILSRYVSQPLWYCILSRYMFHNPCVPEEQSIFLMSQWQSVIKINPKVKFLGQTLTCSLHLPAYRQTNILIQIWMTLSGLQSFLQEDDRHIMQHFIETPSPSTPHPTPAWYTFAIKAHKNIQWPEIHVVHKSGCAPDHQLEVRFTQPHPLYCILSMCRYIAQWVRVVHG